MRLASAFAGSFYPESPDALLQQIDGFLGSVDADAPSTTHALCGGIVPHAGYVYSGRCAAHLYARLAQQPAETIVLLGPSHRIHVEGAAILELEAFETPLGPVASNTTFAEELLRRVPGLHVARAFNEHSLEVQLPFLRRVAPQSQVVAIAFGIPELELSRRLGRALGKMREEGAAFSVLASSDLSHFHRRTLARRLDGRFAERVTSLQTEALWEDLQEGETEACGAGGVLALLEFARCRGARLQLLDSCDSADVTQDEDEVVGYLSAALLESKPA